VCVFFVGVFCFFFGGVPPRQAIHGSTFLSVRRLEQSSIPFRDSSPPLWLPPSPSSPDVTIHSPFPQNEANPLSPFFSQYRAEEIFPPLNSAKSPSPLFSSRLLGHIVKWRFLAPGNPHNSSSVEALRSLFFPLLELPRIGSHESQTCLSLPPPPLLPLAIAGNVPLTPEPRMAAP